MAVPGTCSFYVSPNTITDLTAWRNGNQLEFETMQVQGDYIYCSYFGQLGGTATLKAPGYEDLEISIYEGPSAYYTMIPIGKAITDGNGKVYMINGKAIFFNGSSS